jgi:hypothetical protein
MKRWLLIAGILLLFATEILRVYFIMPFPGSQHADTIGFAYFIDHNRIWLRILGALLISYPLYDYWRRSKRFVGFFLLALLYAVVFYFFNYRFEADKMFYQPGSKRFAGASANTIGLNKLVIGVVINNEAKAYPIQLIGYHHQVRDTIGNTPVMITYCTVCRTGRVFSPLVRGKAEDFRLVGMDHFNAMFEDVDTKSWWQQATGVAIAGPLKGTRLQEIPSTQSTLGEWLRQYPDAQVFQPDTTYAKRYAGLADYDDGLIKSGLEHRDTASWRAKSWVVGVRSVAGAKAYDWNDLLRHTLIQDTIGALPIALVLADSTVFHTWNRSVAGQTLQLERVPGQPLLRDGNTGSLWNAEGLCVEGTLKGRQLQAVQCYQEFWHSWSYFHPETTRY